MAENIGIPQATFIETVEAKDGYIVAKRIIECGYQMMKLPMPCALSLTPTGIAPRRPILSGAVKARNSEITVFNIDDVGLSDEKIGLSGSPAIVAKVQNIVSERAPIMMSSSVDAMLKNITSGKTEVEVKEKKLKKRKKT